ncbi:stalk domain-containing protein [Cohnella suwonensis]|uniref:Stalk domain-containing protein n=1 Tax=Cohnella suwonensis TaxID=696072 RepID=A0ABW0LXG8_9BACL
MRIAKTFLLAAFVVALAFAIGPRHTDAAQPAKLTVAGLGNEANEYVSVRDRVYLPLKQTAQALAYRTIWDARTRSITLQGIDKKITLTKRALSGADFYSKNGRTYASLAFYSKNLGLTYNTYDAAKLIKLSSPYYYKSEGDHSIWVDKKTTMLYYAKGTRQPLPINKTNLTFLEQATFADATVKELSQGVVYMRVTENYGEPSLNFDTYQALIKNGKVVKQQNKSFHGWRDHEDVEFVDQGVLFNDGDTATIYGKDGSAALVADLTESLGFEGPFVVEAVQDRFWFVREYRSSKLSLLDIRSGKSILLYKQLLNPDEIAILDEQKSPAIGENVEFNTFGDHLTFKKIDMAKKLVYFDHLNWLKSEKSTLVFDLSKM